jgi:bifunctional enzyme CysN/CysC
VTLETLKPIACDLSSDLTRTGRFVIIDNYEIAGGGVVLKAIRSDTNRVTERVRQREMRWQRSAITPDLRAGRYNQRSTLVLLCGPADTGQERLAKALAEDLFDKGRHVYYLGLSNSTLAMDVSESGERDEYIRRLGEVSHLFTDAGLILIATISDLDDYELETISALNQPSDYRIINVGPSRFNRANVDLQIDELTDTREAVRQIEDLLTRSKYLIEYYL